MASKKHLHKYYFGMLVGNQPVWACALDGCNHYMPNHMKNTINGKLAICWKCGDNAKIDFTRMNEYPDGKVFCDECLLLRKLNAEKPKLDTEPQVTQIESHINEVPICKQCKQHPMSITFNNGLCTKCHFDNFLNGVK